MGNSDETGRPRAEQSVTSVLLSGGTYRGLGEQVLSPAEERFERARRTVGFVLAPLVTIVFLLLPTGLDVPQHRLAAVLLGVVVLWVCEPVPIPVGGLIGVAAIVMLGVMPPDDVLAPFGSSTVFTFIGAFILAQAMLRHGLARRFAFALLSLPGVGRSAARVIVAFGVITCLLSSVVSNTATVAMLLPTAVGILAVIAELVRRETPEGAPFDPLRLRVGVALMLMLAYGASVGGLLTPIGSPPNLIGRALIEETTGQRISFLQWMVMAIPVCLAMFLVLAVLLLLLNRPEIKKLSGVEEYVAGERVKLGRLSRAEKNTLVAFTITVALWVTPGIVALVAGNDSAAYDAVSERLDEGIVAVLGAALLFVLPTDWPKRRFTLTWTEASRIDWGTVLLFGTGIIFGSMLAETRLAQTIGIGVAGTLGLVSAVGITLFAIALAVLVSETTSNTASASVVVPIIIPIAAAAGISPFVPALAATFAASFGFMLPVSTPQNAIVYGSGAVPITRMIRSGIVFDIAGAVLIALLLPLMVAAVGF
ncbi:sodium-dependent dicarboxylate transporter 2/3/5 [Saccharopolyspora erythraea NRRL 2338]|uniref:Sodium-dependent dicarboxylate transporter SdcS n=2 Tax=Saccharopolyspora erythraea TaxID=1836 RepID=A4FA57_SACEN|nr:DASS family sodium-coupled anion symporter [Saccharopolyspora erythraea]EQD83641.1 anion transporter [Saccharopolyspora erythraea D]PFG94719.1 sodium-dependent dicarboxylate transporter 2/3/5 [Saccharopolyspora erythraea NRRL 2338]QRK91441.1 DASS family sodium-coupled anion symporter [Saccharopolyspora erythraea]CAM00932.1 anion transporter [Saccharopolyspora erythraea NRRL 2338]